MWRCNLGRSGFGPCFVPPSPEVMTDLYMRYKRSGLTHVSFRDYLVAIGFVDPAASEPKMDDGRFGDVAQDGLHLLALPTEPVSGDLDVMVLLVDFEDREGELEREHYEELLFSEGRYPTGSMRDYFAEATHGHVAVSGSVHGWLRMPQRYSYYVNGESGTKWSSYPKNAPRLAEDAVQIALSAGIEFPPNLDKLDQGAIAALFIVHAGRGAEKMRTKRRQDREIWSHKWDLRNPVDVGNGMLADRYLVVPHDCDLGVCAHELGHLAFQWQDFYDPNYEEGGEWDGAGKWDLMAGGSYNGSSQTPAHPACLHKSQHGWIPVDTIESSQTIELPPIVSDAPRAVRVVSPHFQPGQYLMLESRVKAGFDFALPGEGLLVWRVDESKEQTGPDDPGMMLVQADGRRDLENPSDWNQGDAGDPFPGSTGKRTLKDTGGINTSFPGGPRSGISLHRIRRLRSGAIRVEIRIEP